MSADHPTNMGLTRGSRRQAQARRRVTGMVVAAMNHRASKVATRPEPVRAATFKFTVPRRGKVQRRW